MFAVEDLLLWRDPKKSGAVFVGATLFYILLHWTGLSLLTIVANSLLILVSLSFLWNNIASFAGRWDAQASSLQSTKCRFVAAADLVPAAQAGRSGA